LRGSASSKRQQLPLSPLRKLKERLNPGLIPPSLIPSLGCKETVKFERLANRMRFSFTTVALCAPRRWQSTSVTRFPPFLRENWSASRNKAIYQNRVFFIRNLGFITPTEARLISFEETVRFEKVHEEIYRDFGFELVSIEPASVVERVGIIKAAIR
jgi:hypothetical protein